MNFSRVPPRAARQLSEEKLKHTSRPAFIPTSSLAPRWSSAISTTSSAVNSGWGWGRHSPSFDHPISNSSHSMFSPPPPPSLVEPVHLAVRDGCLGIFDGKSTDKAQAVEGHPDAAICSACTRGRPMLRIVRLTVAVMVFRGEEEDCSPARGFIYLFIYDKIAYILASTYININVDSLRVA